MDGDAVRGIGHLGGTILGTTNRGDPFRYAVLQDGQKVPMDVSDKIVRRFRDLGLDALVALGGGADVILIPEIPFRLTRVCEKIEERYCAIVVVSEPVSFDRLLAQRLGSAAVRYPAESTDGSLVAQVGGELSLVPLEQVKSGTRGV